MDALVEEEVGLQSRFPKYIRFQKYLHGRPMQI